MAANIVINNRFRLLGGFLPARLPLSLSERDALALETRSIAVEYSTPWGFNRIAVFLGADFDEVLRAGGGTVDGAISWILTHEICVPHTVKAADVIIPSVGNVMVDGTARDPLTSSLCGTASDFLVIRPVAGFSLVNVYITPHTLFAGRGLIRNATYPGTAASGEIVTVNGRNVFAEIDGLLVGVTFVPLNVSRSGYMAEVRKHIEHIDEPEVQSVVDSAIATTLSLIGKPQQAMGLFVPFVITSDDMTPSLKRNGMIPHRIGPMGTIPVSLQGAGSKDYKVRMTPGSGIRLRVVDSNLRFTTTYCHQHPDFSMRGVCVAGSVTSPDVSCHVSVDAATRVVLPPVVPVPMTFGGADITRVLGPTFAHWFYSWTAEGGSERATPNVAHDETDPFISVRDAYGDTMTLGSTSGLSTYSGATPEADAQSAFADGVNRSATGTHVNRPLSTWDADIDPATITSLFNYVLGEKPLDAAILRSGWPHLDLRV